MSARRGLLQDSSSSSSDEQRQDLMEDEGDQHFPPVKKQVVSNKNSKAKHISSKADTQILPSRASSSKRRAEPDKQILPSRASSSKRRAADSPDPRQRKQKRDKKSKKNEQVPSDGEEQEEDGEEQEEDVTGKTEDLSKRSFSKNKVRSKEKHVALHHAIDALPSGVVSSKSLSKKKKEEQVKEAVVEDKNLKKKEDTSAVKKKQLIQRVWSEGDETIILKGLIDYGGSNAASVDMNKFYEVIKDSLHLDATKTQLISKVSKMKRKYQATLLKGKKGKNGINSEVFQLGKEIWGTGGNSKNLDMVEFGGASCAGPSHSHVGAENLDNQISISVSRLNTGAKKLEIEKKWKELKRKGIELNLEKIELLREAATIEAEELNSEL